MICLWLDDERPPPPGKEWLWVRDANICIELLQNLVTMNREMTDEESLIVHLDLDHDLGQDLTGYAVISELEQAHERGIPIPKSISCHSMNPAGKARIEQVIARLMEGKV